jgi:hypothetical protein
MVGALVTVLVRAVVLGFLSVVDPITLLLRSTPEVAGLAGVLVDGVPARDMRFAALLIPFFSSPELGTPFTDFSSAELLIDALDR